MSANRKHKDFSSIDISVNIDNATHTASLADDIGIDDNDLDWEFTRQSELFAWWACVAELCKADVASRKFELEKLYAHVDYRVRTDAQTHVDPKTKEAKPIRITEKMVENSVITDKEYQIAHNAYLLAKKNLGLVQAGRDALNHKREMLVSKGALLRAEGAANPSILKDAAKERQRRKKEEQAAKDHQANFNQQVTEEEDNPPRRFVVHTDSQPPKFPGKRKR